MGRLAEDRRWLELYLAHRPALIKFAAPIVGDRARAEDIVQDAYMRFSQPGENRPIDQPVAYLYRIVRNLAFDVVRRRQTEKREEQEGVWWMLPSPTATPEDEVRRRESLRRMEALLAEMEMPMRLAFEMNRLGGYTLQQIADRLDVSVPTAHRLVRGALLKLAVALDDADA